MILGLPGSGKSRLALATAEALCQADLPAFVLHTDLLKISLRKWFPDELKGPGYNGDFRAKCERMRPFLEAQADKARRDGYRLIVEGTLALNFVPEPGLRVILEIGEKERLHRISLKHRSARMALDSANFTDLSDYAKALDDIDGPDVLRVDAHAPLVDLVRQLAAAVQGRG
ncbi:MAG: hypothetical protein R3F37_07850 [Candidatus Competibacteraceae bacterium]